MVEIKAPNLIPDSPLPKVFLAGSIEMGAAQEWQEHAAQLLAKENVIVLNPRRDDWDSTWIQTKENPKFREQVEWELSAMEQADYIVFYFDPTTKSPISLMEIGLNASKGKLFVVCPEGYWRKGNVDIVCERYGFPQFASLDEMVAHLASCLESDTLKK